MSFSVHQWGSDIFTRLTSCVFSLPRHETSLRINVISFASRLFTLISKQASPFSSLPRHEIFPTQCKIILSAPALLALGAHKALVYIGAHELGSLPWQSAVIAFAVADLAFHYFVENSRNSDTHYKAKKFESMIQGVRLAVFGWSIGCLVQVFRDQLFLSLFSAESILKVYPILSYRRHKFEYYITHFSDRWLLSWPVTGILVYALKKLARKDQSLNKPGPIYARDLYLSSWLAALQLVTYVSLAVFSKSPVIFATLSALSLYTFYQRVSHRKLWVELSYKIKDIKIQYQEIVVVKNEKEEQAELFRLWKEVNFVVFNPLQHTRDYVCQHVDRIPFLGSDPERVLHKSCFFQSVMHPLEVVKLKVIHNYQPGEMISVYLNPDSFEGGERLSLKLEDGTRVVFPLVLSKMIFERGLDRRTVTAKILSTSCSPTRQLELTVSSLNLPEKEELSLEREQSKYGKRIYIKGTASICSNPGEGACCRCSEMGRLYDYEGIDLKACRSCIEINFRNEIEKIHVLNIRRGGFGMEASTEASLPQGIDVRVYNYSGKSIQVCKIGNYNVGNFIQVPMISLLFGLRKSGRAVYDDPQKTLFAFLEDGTIVYFPDTSPVHAKRVIFAMESIRARVVGRHINEEQGFLYVHCVSDSLPPLQGASSGELIQNEPEWFAFLEGVLKTLEAQEVREEIERLEKDKPLYLFLKEVREKKSRHELLGISQGSSQKEISDAYKRKAVIIHPDKNPKNPLVAGILIQVLNIAREGLIES